VIEKLQKWGVNPNDCEKIIEYLKSEKFVDEQRYCRFFVKDKFRFNLWGKNKIAYMLSVKNLPKEFIAEALEQIDYEEYIAALSAMLHSKAKSIKTADLYQKNAKLYRFAQSKGFENEAIRKAVENVI
jgi:regulatory protein